MSNESEYKTSMDETTEGTVTEQAFYDMVIYLPLDELEIPSGSTVNQIIEAAVASQQPGAENKVDLDENVLKEIQKVQAEHPSYGKAKVTNLSWEQQKADSDKTYSTVSLGAATFYNPVSGTRSVNFRGTPGGAWLDNAFGLGIGGGSFSHNGQTWDHISRIDQQALEYYEGIRDSLTQEQREQLLVSGHSKGGHEALLLALVFPEDFKDCYAFDGQSVSPEMWEDIKKNYSPEELEAIRSKISAINVNNDYVHGLGWSELNGYLASTIYMIKGNGCDSNPAANHYIQAFFDDNGNLMDIDPDGEGPLSKFIMAVSDKIMNDDNLTPKQRQNVAQSFMAICQLVLGQEWPEEYSFDEWVDLFAHMDDGLLTGIIMIKEVLEDNPELRAELMEYLGDAVNTNLAKLLKQAEEHPILAQLITRAAIKVAPLVISVVGTLALGLIAIARVVNHVAEAIQFVQKWVPIALNAMFDGAKWLYEKGCDLVNALSHKIAEGAQIVWNFGKKITNMALSAIQSSWLIAKNALEKAGRFISESAKKVTRFVGDLIDDVKQKALAVKEKISEGIEHAKQVLSDVKDDVLSGLKKAGETLKNTFDKAVEHVKNFGTTLKNKVTDLVRKGKGLLDKGVEKVKNGMSNLLGLAAKAKDHLVNDVKNTTGHVKNALENFGKAMKSGADRIIDSVQQAGAKLTSSVSKFGSFLQEKIGGAVKSGVMAIMGGLTGKAGIDYSAMNKAKSLCGMAADQARGSLLPMFDSVLSDLSSLRYASVSAGPVMSARSQVVAQIQSLEQHKADLCSYESRCRSVESGFVQALNVFV